MARPRPRRFQATEQTTYRDLQSTLRRLGATSLRVSARDLLDDADTKAEILFDRGGRRYAIRCDKWPHYLDNLRACERTVYYVYLALSDYGALAVDRSVADTDAFAQFFGGFEATPDLLMLPPGRQWWEVLGVQAQAGEVEIRNAYRALAKVHHPEAGGNPDEFKRLREAYDAGIDAQRGRRP